MINREEYIEEIADEYDDIREDHYENLKERKYLSLEMARERRIKLDWKNYTSSNQCIHLISNTLCQSSVDV